MSVMTKVRATIPLGSEAMSEFEDSPAPLGLTAKPVNKSIHSHAFI